MARALVGEAPRGFVAPAFEVQFAELLERRGDVGVLPAVLAALQGERPLEHRLGALEVAEVEEDAADGAEEPRLNLRLFGEVLLDPRGAVVEDLANGHVGATRHRGVGLLENPDQEFRDPVRCFALLILRDKRSSEAPRLHRHHHAESDERREQGARGRDLHAMPAEELAQSVEAARRPSDDRLMCQVALEILGQLCRRSVAPIAFLGHRPGDDPVELTGELAPECCGFAGAARCALGEVFASRRQSEARQRRLLFADAAQNIWERRALELESRGAGHELVEQRAERVDVGARVEVDAHGRLFRTHGAGCADELAEPGHQGAFVETGIDRPGDAEIDHLGDRPSVLGGDENVGRLEIAMDDPLLVRRVHRAADGRQELDARPDREAPGVAIGGQRGTVDQLHREVGTSFDGRTGVEDAGDRTVVHSREDLALDFEPAHDLARVHAELDQLQGDATLDGRLLDRLEDLPHAAFADRAHDAIGADADSCGGVQRDGRRQIEQPGRERRCFRLMGFEERVELAPEVAVGPARGGQELLSRRSHGALERLVEQRPQPLPTIGFHGPEAPIRGYQDCSGASLARLASGWVSTTPSARP